MNEEEEEKKVRLLAYETWYRCVFHLQSGRPGSVSRVFLISLVFSFILNVLYERIKRLNYRG